MRESWRLSRRWPAEWRTASRGSRSFADPLRTRPEEGLDRWRGFGAWRCLRNWWRTWTEITGSGWPFWTGATSRPSGHADHGRQDQRLALGPHLEAVYLYELGRNLNRARVMVSWSVDLLTRPDTAKLYGEDARREAIFFRAVEGGEDLVADTRAPISGSGSPPLRRRRAWPERRHSSHR
jgi:hypothetical protein